MLKKCQYVNVSFGAGPRPQARMGDKVNAVLEILRIVGDMELSE